MPPHLGNLGGGDAVNSGLHRACWDLQASRSGALARRLIVRARLRRDLWAGNGAFQTVCSNNELQNSGTVQNVAQD